MRRRKSTFTDSESAWNLSKNNNVLAEINYSHAYATLIRIFYSIKYFLGEENG